MIPTLHTLEVRWFAPGAAPQPIREWFAGIGEAFIQPPRTDRYLLGLDATVGIKTRQGSLEVKQCTTNHGEHRFGPHLAGQVESWVKWSFPLDAAATLTDLSSANWASVRKTRQLLFYTFTAQGEIIPCPPGDFLHSSGGLELTEIMFDDQDTWWTLGLELAGFPPDDPAPLMRLAEHLLHSPPAELTQAQSLSYPAWLEMVARK